MSKFHAFLVLLAGVLLSSCGELPGFTVNSKVDSFRQVAVTNDKIDILFVIDNSGSMAEEQANLAASFNGFINQFINKQLKFHIGVISTEVINNSTRWNGSCYGGATQPIYNNGSHTLLSRTFGERFLTWQSSSLVSKFQANVNLGTCGSGAEVPLQSATGFFNTSLITGSGWNTGFLRSDAYLSVIILSDEDEGNTNTDTTYICNFPSNRSSRVNFFKNTLRNLKPGREDQIRVDSIVRQYTAPWCPGPGAFEGTSEVLEQAATEMGGSVINIGQDFSDELLALGDNLIRALTRFKLVQPPNGDLEVYVNGVLVPQNAVNGWVYLADTNEVEFRGTAIPAANSQINVVYVPARPIN